WGPSICHRSRLPSDVRMNAPLRVPTSTRTPLIAPHLRKIILDWFKGAFPMRVRSLTVLFAVLALSLTGGLGAQAKPNFSGVWVLVPDKSDFGPLPAPASMTRTITHNDPSLKIVTVQSGGATGDTTIQTTFSTDGKPQSNTVSGNAMT